MPLEALMQMVSGTHTHTHTHTQTHTPHTHSVPTHCTRLPELQSQRCVPELQAFQGDASSLRMFFNTVVSMRLLLIVLI